MMQMNEVQALVEFGKLGVRLVAMRILSAISMLGFLALAAYSVYTATWQGVVVCAIVGFLGVIPAIRAEAKRDATPGQGAQ